MTVSCISNAMRETTCSHMGFRPIGYALVVPLLTRYMGSSAGVTMKAFCCVLQLSILPSTPLRRELSCKKRGALMIPTSTPEDASRYTHQFEAHVLLKVHKH